MFGLVEVSRQFNAKIIVAHVRRWRFRLERAGFPTVVLGGDVGVFSLSGVGLLTKEIVRE